MWQSVGFLYAAIIYMGSVFVKGGAKRGFFRGAPFRGTAPGLCFSIALAAPPAVAWGAGPAHQSAPRGEPVNGTFSRVPVRFVAHTGAYEGEGKYGGAVSRLDSDGSLAATETPTAVSVRPAGTTPKGEKDWRVVYTMKQAHLARPRERVRGTTAPRAALRRQLGRLFRNPPR
jgi:hypothetical protein